MSKKEQKLNIDNLERNRKRLSFKFTKLINHVMNRKPKVKFTGEPLPDEPVIILSNHVGRSAPLKIELYHPRDLRMWGAHEMTEGLKAVRKYFVYTYLFEKKHYPKWWAILLGTIISPFPNAFYKGMRLIPSYTDERFLTTIKYSVEAYNSGKDIFIFPEDSSKGYLDEIVYFYSGFVSLLEMLYRKGKDAAVFVTYFNKKTNTFIYSRQYRYSELKKEYESFDNIADNLRIIMNSLKDK